MSREECLWGEFLCCRECLCAVGHLSLWDRLFYGNNLLAVGESVCRGETLYAMGLVCVLRGESVSFG